MKRPPRAAVRFAAAALAFALPAAALADFADEDARNFSKTNERYEHLTGTPEFQAELRATGLEQEAELAQIALNDPERNPFGNLCAHHTDGCAGDIRFYDWDQEAGNTRLPVLWTARSGATISGHVWAVEAGPARRPGVVITNGSVQAPEQLYWAQAATLARGGYVVLTWDPQTQGRSDGPGEPPTDDENAQPQTPEQFTEGTIDALDFLLSTPESPFLPRNSRTMPDVNHAEKQNRRVAGGLNAAFNPLHAMLDPSRIGVAGNSLGALGVSHAASVDPRVDAVVGWDNLRATDELPPRVPGLGLSGDYAIGGSGCAAAVFPRPCSAPPDPQSTNSSSRAFSSAGIATGQLNTRAGTHFESALIPNAGFGATLRGIDKLAWYTLAWVDRFLKADPAADARLLTNRWHKDAANAEIDPDEDPNLFSRYLRSRLDFRRADGSRALCEDLREGCGLLVDDSAGSGGRPQAFSALEFAYGRQKLPPSSCASGIRARRKLDLSHSKRRLRVRMTLAQRSRVSPTLRRLRRKGARRGGPRRSAVPAAGAARALRSRRVRAGTRRVVLRLPRSIRPGRFRLRLRLRCAAGTQRARLPLRLVR